MRIALPLNLTPTYGAALTSQRFDIITGGKYKSDSLNISEIFRNNYYRFPWKNKFSVKEIFYFLN